MVDQNVTAAFLEEELMVNQGKTPMRETPRYKMQHPVRQHEREKYTSLPLKVRRFRDRRKADVHRRLLVLPAEAGVSCSEPMDATRQRRLS